jgi:hypothetical protein
MSANKKHFLRPRTNYHKCELSFMASESLANPRHPARSEASTAARAVVQEDDLGEAGAGTAPSASAISPSIEAAPSFKDAALAEQPVTQDAPTVSAPAPVLVVEGPPSPSSEAQQKARLMPPAKARLRDPLAFSERERPLLSVSSPSGVASTREGSMVSTASFATAQESFHEHASLSASLADLEDEDLSSDSASTVRGVRSPSTPSRETPPTVYADSDESGMSHAPTNTSEAASGRALVQNDTQDRVPAMKDFKSAMKQTSRDPVTVPLVRQNSHLVHFASSHQAQSERSAGHGATQHSRRICPEGHQLALASRKSRFQHEQGFMNQKFLKNPFRKVRHEGELLRAERMLLRIECAKPHSVPNGYNDFMMSKLERRTDMHWREFVLAARPNAKGHVVLYFHRNRTIPAIAKKITSIKATKEIVLDPAKTRANLYSTLDKTITIWTTDANGKRDWIFILRPRTVQTSVEWYAFIQTCLGVKRRRFALMTVPTLGVKVKLELPNAGASRTSMDDNENLDGDDGSDAELQLNDEGAVVDALGNPITGNYLVDKCLTLLEEEPAWRQLVDCWRRTNHVGLCWRRYDRIEWLHGPSAQRAIGQWAMAETHELELRPKEHYPTSVQRKGASPAMDEPAPIEGFLVRLTSSTGRQSRFGKVFYKRLYFSTHDGLLFYAIPMAASPPPPPSFEAGIPENCAEEIVKRSPLIYDVEPYPIEDGKIAWACHTVPETIAKHDRAAMMEAARRVRQLHASTGYLDLTKVKQIRRYKQTQDDVEHNLANGEGVDFDGAQEADFETGVENPVDDARIFEIVLDSGLVVRLQAFNAETRRAWMSQLRQLVQYWKRRLAEDEEDLAAMRRNNIETLRIDESIEPIVDLVCNRWEVSHCVSEPKRYNYCSITSCRTIAIQGLLYRKPRVHSTFKRYNCVVSHGKLFVYNHFHYHASGNIEHHIHNSKRQEIDLSDCYIFSGMITAGDLLDSREDFCRTGTGHKSIPRLYADGWTSQDEQEALCFVLWTGRRRVALTQLDKKDSGSKKSVSRLGVAGRSMVYLCRCRQERDLWVQLISREIERTAQESLSPLCLRKM